ncbi:MAG: extracellular solute-binding protein [Lachnospiraceae bacterium]
MRRKKLIAIGMSVCLACGMISGCSSGIAGKEKTSRERSTGAESTDVQATGKYVEEEVNVPKDAGDLFVINADGALELYGETENCEPFYYVQKKDGSWEKKDAEWLGKEVEREICALAYAPDGTAYAVVKQPDNKLHLLKKVDEKTAEEITIPELNASDMEQMSGPFFYGIQMAFLKNGSLVLAGIKDVRVYDVQSGKRLDLLKPQESSTMDTPMAVNGNCIALPNETGDGYVIRDEEKKKEVKTCSWSGKIEDTKLLLDEDGSLYTLNEKGISHLQPGGSIAEQLVQGDLMSMGSPSCYIDKWYAGPNHDFYVHYEKNDEDAGFIMHYYFDKNASTKVEHMLTVYSLKENEVIRQAVNDYNKKHRDVQITYNTGVDDKDTSREDKIRALNTELVNHQGADLLILDDLPEKELEEKGVLLDMQEVLGDLVKTGKLQKNIAEYYQKKDGSIYAMPVRYGMPLKRGDEPYQKAYESLDQMEKWLKENPKKSMFSFSTYRELNRMFLHIFYDEIFNESGNVRPEKCKQYLSLVKELGKNGNAQGDDGEFLTAMDKYDGEMYVSDWLIGDAGATIKGKGMMFTEIDSSLAVAEMYVRFQNPDMKNTIETVNDYFLPRGLVAINAKTAEKETAEDFVNYLFSDESQEKEFYGYGLPMNQKAEQAMIDEAKEMQEAGYTNATMTTRTDVVGEDEEGEEFTGEADRVALEEAFRLADQLKEPQKGEAQLLDMVYEEAKLYYGGTQDLDQTVQGITQKVDTYHAE